MWWINVTDTWYTQRVANEGSVWCQFAWNLLNNAEIISNSLALWTPCRIRSIFDYANLGTWHINEYRITKWNVTRYGNAFKMSCWLLNDDNDDTNMVKVKKKRKCQALNKHDIYNFVFFFFLCFFFSCLCIKIISQCDRCSMLHIIKEKRLSWKIKQKKS